MATRRSRSAESLNSLRGGPCQGPQALRARLGDTVGQRQSFYPWAGGSLWEHTEFRGPRPGIPASEKNTWGMWWGHFHAISPTQCDLEISRRKASQREEQSCGPEAEGQRGMKLGLEPQRVGRGGS